MSELKPKEGDAFWDSLQRASDAVDTWPDWMLDESILRRRNKRRLAGEVLPKITPAQRVVNAAVGCAFAPTSIAARAELFEAVDSLKPCRRSSDK